MKNLSTKFGTSLLVFAALIGTTLIGATTTAHSAEKIAWKFKAKQTLNYKLKVEATMGMNGGPGGPGGAALPPMTTTQEMDVVWTIDKVNKDGSCQMTQVTKRVVFNFNMGALMQVKFDSANPNAGGVNPMIAPMLEPYKALVGEKTLVTMAANGKITKIELPKKLLKVLANAANGGAQIGGGGVSKEAMIGMIKQSSPVFSDKAVSVNDKWNNSVTMKNPIMTSIIKNSYQYAGTEKQGKNSYAKIKVTPKMTIKNAGAAAGQPAVTLKKQSGTGIILFDVANGTMKSHVSKQTMNIDMNMGGGPAMSMDVENNITMQLVPEKK